MREIGRALQLSAGAVSKYRCAVRKAGLTWEEAQHLTDTERCMSTYLSRPLSSF